jgi:hypothetical protein
VNIAEARGHQGALGVHDAMRPALERNADIDDEAVFDGHIRLIGRTTRAVDHFAVSDQRIVHAHLPETSGEDTSNRGQLQYHQFLR